MFRCTIVQSQKVKSTENQFGIIRVACDRLRTLMGTVLGTVWSLHYESAGISSYIGLNVSMRTQTHKIFNILLIRVWDAIIDLIYVPHFITISTFYRFNKSFASVDGLPFRSTPHHSSSFQPFPLCLHITIIT